MSLAGGANLGADRAVHGALAIPDNLHIALVLLDVQGLVVADACRQVRQSHDVRQGQVQAASLLLCEPSLASSDRCSIHRLGVV